MMITEPFPKILDWYDTSFVTEGWEYKYQNVVFSIPFIIIAEILPYGQHYNVDYFFDRDSNSLIYCLECKWAAFDAGLASWSSVEIIILMHKFNK